MKECKQARKALAETTEEHLMKPWRFIAGGRVQSNQPRHVMLSDQSLLIWLTIVAS